MPYTFQAPRRVVGKQPAKVRFHSESIFPVLGDDGGYTVTCEKLNTRNALLGDGWTEVAAEAAAPAAPPVPVERPEGYQDPGALTTRALAAALKEPALAGNLAALEVMLAEERAGKNRVTAVADLRDAIEALERPPATLPAAPEEKSTPSPAPPAGTLGGSLGPAQRPEGEPAQTVQGGGAPEPAPEASWPEGELPGPANLGDGKQGGEDPLKHILGLPASTQAALHATGALDGSGLQPPAEEPAPAADPAAAEAGATPDPGTAG